MARSSRRGSQWGVGAAAPATRERTYTVSYNSFDSDRVKSTVSNPRAIAYVHFKLPCERSNLPGSGPIFDERARVLEASRV